MTSIFAKFLRGSSFVAQPVNRQAWPTPADFRSAIQNPGHCFADDVLRSAVPSLDPLGLPRPISGNFATVFHLVAHGHSFAVRCFCSAVSNQEARYLAATSYIATSPRRSPLIDFEYLREGIQIRGIWYPLLIMEWIQGETLDRYISNRLSDLQSLTKLADDWLNLNRELRQACIAHGDLQHGNVLVDQDANLRLVDYDGMFVPSLSLEPPQETRGNRNYQHPGRISNGHYALEMDTFSAIVIYLSILALHDEPSLWDKYNTGENLIFSEADFKNPGGTGVWRDLEKMDGDIPKLAATLKACADGEFRR